MSGQIVDATLVVAPRQRNTDAEKARIKAGESADKIWPEKPAKARQKDVDARWTVKHSKAKPAPDGTPRIDIAIPAFGYKSHISIDRRHGIIRRAKVTDAFGAALGPMGLVIRTIGLTRATAAVTLANIAYNMKRWCWLDRRSLLA
jgi:hypothetical protein